MLGLLIIDGTTVRNFYMVLFRQDGQGTRDEYKGKDYRGDLEERERVALRERTKERARRYSFLGLAHTSIDAIIA